MAGVPPSLDFKALQASAEAGDAAAQLRLAQLLRQAGDATRANQWLELAAAQGLPNALGERGALCLARLDLDGALAGLSAAADAKDTNSLLTLAGMAATGVAPALGGWRAAVAMTIEAAQLGNKAAWRELGVLAAMAGLTPRSDSLIAHAAALGDGIAVYLTLVRQASGAMALGPSRAQAYRSALKRIRFPLDPPGEAAGTDSFPAPGAAPPIDWDILTEALRDPPGLVLSQPKSVSAGPDIWLARDFFTHEECDYAVASGAPSLAPARVIDPATGQGRLDSLRTNLAAAESTAWMSPAKAALAMRLAKLAQLSLAQAEPAGLLCYKPGEEYRPHFDWLGPGPLFDEGGQRLRTVLVYLNADYTGGQTRFLSPGFDVPAKKGDAALFVNAAADGTPDMSTRHAGMPVLTGVKYIWSQWYRERSVMPLTQQRLTSNDRP